MYVEMFYLLCATVLSCVSLLLGLCICTVPVLGGMMHDFKSTHTFVITDGCYTFFHNYMLFL